MCTAAWRICWRTRRRIPLWLGELPCTTRCWNIAIPPMWQRYIVNSRRIAISQTWTAGQRGESRRRGRYKRRTVSGFIGQPIKRRKKPPHRGGFWPLIRPVSGRPGRTGHPWPASAPVPPRRWWCPWHLPGTGGPAVFQSPPRPYPSSPQCGTWRRWCFPRPPPGPPAGRRCGGFSGW